jgi:hypothetical protein
MFKRLLKLAQSALAASLFSLIPHVLAKSPERFSFEPLQKCMLSGRPPPKALLTKRYKIYTGLEKWRLKDINGDGICDWIRGGYEGYRTDQEAPPVGEFIYLGTSTGWRKIAQSKRHIREQGREDRVATRGVLEPYVEAYNFYAPVFIYSPNRRAPYVLSLSRPDAPAPAPGIDDVLVMRWDDSYDLLRFISENERLAVLGFAKIEVCKGYQNSIRVSGTNLFKDAICD